CLRSSSRKAAIPDCPSASLSPALVRTPIRRIRCCCCARAASGQMAEAPSSDMNRRRSIDQCPYSEVRMILMRGHLRTSESKDTSKLLIWYAAKHSRVICQFSKFLEIHVGDRKVVVYRGDLRGDRTELTPAFLEQIHYEKRMFRLRNCHAVRDYHEAVR